MITSAEYYATKTVAELRAILATDGIKVSSRTKKADLVTYVVNMLDDFHAVAIEMKAQLGPAEITPAKAMWMVYKGIGNGKRTQNYVRQNGTHKLTPAQNRRINKKGNREFGYSTKNLQVLTNA